MATILILVNSPQYKSCRLKPTSPINCLLFPKDPVEAIGFRGNTTIAEGGVKNISCPVDGNPQPSILWYKGSEVRGGKISSERQLTVKVNVGEIVCFTCVASNFLGTVTITQCLIVRKSLSFIQIDYCTTPVHICLSMSVCLSIYLSIYPSIYPSIYSIYL